MTKTFEFDTVSGSTYVVDRGRLTITRKPGLRKPDSGVVERRPTDFQPQPLAAVPEVEVGKQTVFFTNTPANDLMQVVTSTVTAVR